MQKNNLNLKMLRVMFNFSQDETAHLLGVSRPTYVRIEGGYAGGSVKLWLKVKKLFKLSNEELGAIMCNTAKNFNEK